MTTAGVLSATRASEASTLIEDFRSFVAARPFPCVGAKSALNRKRLDFALCDRLGSSESAEVLRGELSRFSARHPSAGVDPLSFVAIFREPVTNEASFHRRLWMQLQAVHDVDAQTNPWAAGVSDDPTSPEFSFSVASRAFFVVGLHPHASRIARRAPRPTLVFNFHDQFEALRASGRYEKLQASIRERDVALQGDTNPALARFGETSEAFQYSGRPNGRCPFHARRRSA